MGPGSRAPSASRRRAPASAPIDLDAVPLRERGLEPFEILTSESQERMLAVVAPDRVDEVRAVCERWGLPAVVLGRLVDGGALRVRIRGATVAEVSARSLADEGPEREASRAPGAQDDL